MLRFMVIGAPRSGTAWCANWLSHGAQLCLHDPLWDRHYTDLDAIEHPRLGVACTGMAEFHSWVNKHPCPKVILHRTPALVNESLRKMGLPDYPPERFADLWKIHGLHAQWTDLFNENAVDIHLHLKLGPIDLDRWQMLRYLNITEDYTKRKQNPAVWARLQQERGKA